MTQHRSIGEWVATTRFWSFPVSAMPIIVTFAYLFARGEVPGRLLSWGILVLSLVGVVLLHAAGNLLSDWFDYRTGVDNREAFAVPNLVFGKFRPQEYLTLSMVLFVLGISVGLFLVSLTGMGTLIVGLVAFVLTASYSWLKYHALGDLDIFIIFGVLTVIGLAYAVTGRWCTDALVLSLPIGIITVSVLHANNTLDIPTDRAAGIRTFAMIIGEEAAVKLYCWYMVLPFLCVIAAVAAGLLPPLTLVSLLAGLKAYKNFRQAVGYRTVGREAMKMLDVQSSQLQLQFSLFLTLGLIISYWL